MNGDRQLLAMRSALRTPAAVWVTDSDDDYSRTTARDWHTVPNHVDGRYHAHLRIEAGDIPEALDLRCVVGLEVHLSTDRGATRFHRLFEALKAAGASVVVGLVDDHLVLHRTEPEAIHG